MKKITEIAQYNFFLEVRNDMKKNHGNLNSSVFIDEHNERLQQLKELMD
jgi:hypothetical protein